MSLREPHRAVFSLIEEYCRRNTVSPTIREMTDRLSRSHGSIQNSLKRLEEDGYIKREGRKARNIKVLKPASLAPSAEESGLPILGDVAAGYCHYSSCGHYTSDEAKQYLEIEYPDRKSGDYALKVSGDSMVGASIPDGAYVCIRRVPSDYLPKPKQVVAVWIEGEGTTLKYFYHQEGPIVVLEAANSKYRPIVVDTRERQIEVQGIHLFTYVPAAISV